MTSVELRRIDDDFLFETTNADGKSVRADAGVATGGHGAGVRPMEMLLAAVASCSSIDVVLLLRKQRQEPTDLRVRVTGERREEEPRIFTAIRVHYVLAGELNEKKVERACRLSMEKMCSVSLMLKAGGVDITWSYEINSPA